MFDHAVDKDRCKLEAVVVSADPVFVKAVLTDVLRPSHAFVAVFRIFVHADDRELLMLVVVDESAEVKLLKEVVIAVDTPLQEVEAVD